MHKRSIKRYPQTLADEIKQSQMHPVLQRVYSHRDITHLQQVDYSLERMLPLNKLTGLDKAVPILIAAIKNNQKILIVGDFDADGATSTAVCLRALTMMGAQQVTYLVPNRFDFGYGLTPKLVEVAKQNSPDVLITVDNGISSVDGVKAASQAGMKVVVTDHHLAGEVLPAADAIVNPNQPGCDFPSKNLAGVGVIFYVMLALRQALRDAGWFNATRPQPNMAKLLDIVALGTVADVVPLDANNRILVAQGIKRIRAGQCCVGIQALLQVAGREMASMVASDLGFAVGPRLNAAGRLDDMSLGIECLLTDDMSRALHISQQLDELNKSRREIEQGMQQQALISLKPLLSNLQNKPLPKGLCLFDAQWHQGVIGILASRIKEKFNRPVIAFASSGDGEIKGSARSLQGLHIRDALDTVAKNHPGLIIKFGGHAMAAGLSIKEADFEVFNQAFNKVADEQLNDAALQGVIDSDGELSAAEISLQLAEELRTAGPWGQRFPEPTFDGEFEVTDWRVVGERHLKMQLAAADSDQLIDAIAFNMEASLLEQSDGFIHAAYRLDVNNFRNKKTLQLIVEYFENI
jgi:single-stranded-DNA-specific exonuclease